VGHVLLDGAFRHEQDARDRAVRTALRHQAEHFALTRTERVLAFSRLVRAEELGDHLRIERGAARGDPLGEPVQTAARAAQSRATDPVVAAGARFTPAGEPPGGLVPGVTPRWTVRSVTLGGKHRPQRNDAAGSAQ
jgi:hypothetical protein